MGPAHPFTNSSIDRRNGIVKRIHLVETTRERLNHWDLFNQLMILSQLQLVCFYLLSYTMPMRRRAFPKPCTTQNAYGIIPN